MRKTDDEFVNHYDTLQVSQKASDEVIRAAYRMLAQMNHPDKNLDDTMRANEATKKITTAYAVLSDPKTRAEHDAKILAHAGLQNAVSTEPEFEPKKESSFFGSVFMKSLSPSAALSAIVGSGPLARTEVTKRVWDYIKTHDLQDENNKRMINADKKLKKVFGGKAQVSMFEMTKLISDHLR